MSGVLMRPSFARPWHGVAALAGAALLALTALWGLAGPRRAAAPSVATLNGDVQISVREFERALLGERALVLNTFQQRAGVGDGRHFWTTPMAGQTPIDLARTRALGVLTRQKVQLVLARRAGLIQDLSDQAMLAELARENDRRRAVLARGGVIYGPTQYDEAGYLDYRLTNLVQAQVRALATRPRSREALVAYYQQVKARTYQAPGRVVVDLLHSPAWAAAEQARAALGAGEPLGAVARRLHLATERHTLDAQTARAWARTRPFLFDQAQRLPVGGVSPVLRDAAGAWLLHVQARVAGASLPFDQVQADVRLRLAEAEYRQQVDAAVRAARLRVHRAALEQVGQAWWRP